MPGRPVQQYKVITAIDGSPAAAAETTIAHIGGIDTIDADSLVIFNVLTNITIGTTGTSWRLRIRRDSLTGTTVADSGVITGGVTAAQLFMCPLFGQDQPGAVASQSYFLTATIGAATAASTVNNVFLGVSTA